jgi:RNA recognition motif-containing protein
MAPTKDVLSISNWRSGTASGNETEPAGPSPAEISRRPHDEWRFRDAQKRLRRQEKAQGVLDRAIAEETRIYVGNMPYTATRADVEKVFLDSGYNMLARIGSVSGVRLLTNSSVNVDISIDRFTLRNPSYCFVDLATNEEAREAMQSLSGVEFKGRPLKIKPCV